MNERLQLKVSIFDAVEPVLIHPSVTVERLFADILREFAAELDLHQRYVLLCEGQVLPAQAPLGSLSLHTDAVLTLSYQESNQRLWSTPSSIIPVQGAPASLYLCEVSSGQLFALDRAPLLIGRRTGPEGLDLTGLPGADTVSRRHAQITRTADGYSITRLEKTNPLLVDGVEVPIGESRPLSPGAQLRLGEMELAVEPIVEGKP